MSLPPCLLPALALSALVVASGLPAAAADPLPPRIALAGTLMLPDTAAAVDGSGDLPVTGLSGVTWLGDDRYAAVMDNSDRLLFFRLEVSPAGEPQAATDLEILVLGERHDYEDVAACPPRLLDRIAEKRRARGGHVPTDCLLVCEEQTPAIRAIDIDTGALLGVVPIPPIAKTRRHNRGLESLAVDPDGSHIWTATEEAVPADGPPATAASGTVVRLMRIAIPGAESASGEAQFAYPVDPPHRFVRVFTGEPLSGVTALVALDRGRLLVLERAAGPGLPPFVSSIYLVETVVAPDVTDVPDGIAVRGELHIAKTPLWQDALGCNIEGLCLGPSLPDGGRLLVAVADNGGLGTPNQLVTLVLRETRRAVDASAVGGAAAIVGLMLLVVRITSP
ncbi:MAG: hypothetical protein RLZZ440_1387 [Planctomycetota bacterium]